MKHWILIMAAIVLCGCAHDNYSVIAGGLGSIDRMSDDLKDCKLQATDAYFASLRQQQHNAALAGAIFGGAIGGAVGGLIDTSANPPETMQAKDIDPTIERCMRDKGYVGTSEN